MKSRSSRAKSAFLSAFLLTACSLRNDPRAVPPTVEAPSIPADFRLSLWRGPCFGSCPAYQVQVDRSGHVDWVGMEYVALRGSSSWEIPTSEVAELLAKCDDLGFFDLRLKCDTLVWDSPGVSVEVTRNGSTRRLSSYSALCDLDWPCESTLHDDPYAHVKFGSFAAAVDEILQTSSRIEWADDEAFRTR